MNKISVNKEDLEKYAEYANLDVEFTTKILDSLSNRIEAIRDEGTINVSVPKHLDTSKTMWLVTDKNGASQIIMCSKKPIRNIEYWMPGNNDYVQAYVGSPFSAKFFGIFWEKAAEELQKMGLPKWEDDPIEIEVSRIKINYY